MLLHRTVHLLLTPVDAGLDAQFVLLAACGADGFVADLDRQRALVGDDVAEMDQAEGNCALAGAESATVKRVACVAATERNAYGKRNARRCPQAPSWLRSILRLMCSPALIAG